MPVTKKLIATIIITALVLGPIPAFTADLTVAAPQQKAQASSPLTPGDAAGIRQAQEDTLDTNDVVYLGGFVAAVTLGGLALSQNNGSGTPSLSTTTTTSP